MNYLREYESDESLPKRKVRKPRKPYLVEWFDDFSAKAWVPFQRYATKERAEQAVIGKNKQPLLVFRLKPEDGDGC